MTTDENETGWSNPGLETTYREARTVLEAQNSVLGDIDTKALQTVRLNVVLIGIVIAAAEIVGPEVFADGWLTLGILALLGSVFLGMITYSESDSYLGPNKEYITQLVYDEFDDTSWDRDLVETYAEWIDLNSDIVRWNGSLLEGAQGLLLVGLILILLSIAF